MKKTIKQKTKKPKAVPPSVAEGRRRTRSDCQEWLADKCFQKGVSGNPAGRPKGSKNSISATFHLALRRHGFEEAKKRLLRFGLDEFGVDTKGATHEEVMVFISIYRATVEWDFRAIKQILRYTMPRPRRQTFDASFLSSSQYTMPRPRRQTYSKDAKGCR